MVFKSGKRKPQCSTTHACRFTKYNNRACYAGQLSLLYKTLRVTVGQEYSCRRVHVHVENTLTIPACVGGEDAPEACQRLLTAVTHTQAMPLALQSLVSKPPPPHLAPAATNSSHSDKQPQLASQAQSAEQQKHAMIIQMTVHAALRPLTAHVPSSPASTSGRQSGYH